MVQEAEHQVLNEHHIMLKPINTSLTVLVRHSRHTHSSKGRK
jgi:hypothetical protein